MNLSLTKENYDLLHHMELFREIETQQISSLIACLSMGKNTYQKGEIIFSLQEKIQKIGILLSGEAQVIQDDFLGNRSIFSTIRSGDLFGESFAFSGVPFSSFCVIAVANCTVLYIDPKKLSVPCISSCDFHRSLIQNMLRIVSLKNIQLTEKIEVLSKRSLREKILSYLSLTSSKNNSSSFQLPFNRQELADYLCSDRSAVSAELSRMMKEGLITYHKNKFTLH